MFSQSVWHLVRRRFVRHTQIVNSGQCRVLARSLVEISDNRFRVPGDATPCRMTGRDFTQRKTIRVILHGVVSPEGLGCVGWGVPAAGAVPQPACAMIGPRASTCASARISGFVGSRFSGLGFRVSSFGSGFTFRVSGFGVRVSGFGFRVSSFGIQVSGFGFRVSGFWFRISGLG